MTAAVDDAEEANGSTADEREMQNIIQKAVTKIEVLTFDGY